MTRFPKEMIENGIHYTLHGDYYFPDLDLPDSPRQTIGHYGRMRKAYLEEHRECTNGSSSPANCMTIWRKQIKSAGIVWNG